ncbi:MULTISPECIES: hypothetical protein [Salipaludibacillus]|nr:hypothetical protein [Salipaludibacillus neizhouensis]
MGSKAKRKGKKKLLWKDLLKRKWEEVNSPKKGPVSHFKWIA